MRSSWLLALLSLSAEPVRGGAMAGGSLVSYTPPESADSSGDPHLSLAHGGTAHEHVKSVPARIYLLCCGAGTVVAKLAAIRPPKPTPHTHTRSGLRTGTRYALALPKPTVYACCPLCFK